MQSKQFSLNDASPKQDQKQDTDYTMPGATNKNFKPHETDKYSMPGDYDKQSNTEHQIKEQSPRDEGYSDNFTENYSSVKNNTVHQDKFKL